jgi:hypothetical protein
MTTPRACPVALSDFPAAHSMDTTWFAIDGKGQVACFSTGDDGVIPASWLHMPSTLWQRYLARKQAIFSELELERDLLLQLAQAAGEKLFTNRAATADDQQTWKTDPYLLEVRDKPWLAGLEPEPENHAFPIVPTLDPSWCSYYGPMLEGHDCLGLVLILPRSFSLEPDFRGEQIFADSERRVLLVERISTGFYRRLHEETACLGCFEVFDQPYRMGVFRYAQHYGRLYARTGAPVDPLTVDTLPASLREYLTLVQLPATDFAVPSEVDLTHQVYCVAYGERFWTLDENTKTVRLNVGEGEAIHYADHLRRYHEAYPQLSAWAHSQGYAIEPPPDFPAAHSMDTTWFAIDRDGHVGVFDTGETGPVPETYGKCDVRQLLVEHGRTDLLAGWKEPSVPSRYDLVVEELHRLGHHSEVIFDLAACLHILNHQWFGRNHIEEWGSSTTVQDVRRNRLGRVLMIVESIDVVGPELESGEATRMPQVSEDGPAVVLFGNLPRASAERIL